MALLVVGWAIAGLFFYALSTFLPWAVLGTIAIVAWAIVRLDSVSRKNKSLASLLCWITCLLTAVCGIALRFGHWHERLMVRLIFVGICLGAGLILLDRCADDWS
jgi:hypothetical protein